MDRKAYFIITSALLCSFGLGFDYDYNGGSFPLPSEMACEGYPIVVRCPGTDVIEVASAEYGRTNSETCATSADKMTNLNCHLPQASFIAGMKCNNKTQCSLDVTSDNFPDPCPGTFKYLRINYKCVKFMFGCPGTLIGIGLNKTFLTSMQPGPGSWSKDPILESNRTFFIPEGEQSVQAYHTLDDFVKGDGSMQVYDLPYPIEATSYVIYDGYFYYIKKKSRRIVKYSFVARLRIKEGSLRGNYEQENRASNIIDLAVDEKGLWAVYAGVGRNGRMDISLINKDTLQIKQTWKTSAIRSQSLHTFVICGVLYVVRRETGEVEYMYNTNAKSNNGKSVSVGFDQNHLFPSEGLLGRKQHKLSPQRLFGSGRRSGFRSFLSYNFTSLMYNPRDRLLYAWDGVRSTAVFYNLHFGAPNPVTTGQPTTTLSTTTTTTRKLSTRKEVVASRTEPPDLAAPPTSPEPGQCPRVMWEWVEWPITEVGMSARVSCPYDGSETAEWRCIKASKQPAQWDPQGPNMSACESWMAAITSLIKSGSIDLVSASQTIARRLTHIAHQMQPLNQDQVKGATELVKLISTSARTIKPPLNSSQSREIVERLVNAVDIIMSSEEAWKSMGVEERFQNVDNVLIGMEEAGFFFINSLLTRFSQDYFYETKEEIVSGTEVSLHAVVGRPGATHLDVRPANDDRCRVVLPGDVMRNQDGLFPAIFIYYNNIGKLVNASVHEKDEGSWRIDSEVVSVALAISKHQELSTPVKMTHRINGEKNLPRKCVYWKYSESDGIGSWSSQGCRTSYNVTHTQCTCDHVTSFAVLVNVAKVQPSSTEQKIAMDVITIVGISISLFCLFFSIVTFSCFRNLQNDYNTIHKNLCLSLFLAESVFLFGISQTSNQLACAIIAGVLHYMFLAAFVWMALESVQLYIMLVQVLETKSYRLWYYALGYGIPLVIVGVSAVVDSSGYGSKDACWLRVDSGFIWSFVGPVCAVILCNLIFVGVTVSNMYRRNRMTADMSKINDLKSSVRGASILLCLLSITWAFGILWIWGDNPIMAYLFCIFSAFQGIFIFVFHCLLQRKVRNEYERLFLRFSCCQESPQTSYVTNSMSFSKHYPHMRKRSPAPDPVNAQNSFRPAWPDASRNSHNPPESATLSVRNDARIPQRDAARLNHHRQPESVPCLQHTYHDTEDAYDHLQRHCHVKDCNQIQLEKARQHERVPYPPARSRTINMVNCTPGREKIADEGEVKAGWRGRKANTMSNMQNHVCGEHLLTSGNKPFHRMEDEYLPRDHDKEGAYLLPLSIQHSVDDEAMMHSDGRKKTAESFRLGRHCLQRKSFTSSGSEDPIVNDLSTSSTTGSKPSSLTCTFNPPVSMGALLHPSSSGWERGGHLHDEFVERDENDLEVQRLTAPPSKHTSNGCSRHLTGSSTDQQRDSAFYPSLPELDNSPHDRYSSNSSQFSARETPRCHHQWPHESGTAIQSRSSADLSVNRACTSHRSDHNRLEDHSAHRHRLPPTDSDLSAHYRSSEDRHYGNHYETDLSNRMMTCL